MCKRLLLIYQIDKLINTQSCLTNDRAQRSPVQFLMVWYNQLRIRIIATQNDMASSLSPDIETETLKSLHALAPGDIGQLTHTTTIIASKRSAGTGRPSSSSTST